MFSYHKVEVHQLQLVNENIGSLCSGRLSSGLGKLGLSFLLLPIAFSCLCGVTTCRFLFLPSSKLFSTAQRAFKKL